MIQSDFNVFKGKKLKNNITEGKIINFDFKIILQKSFNKLMNKFRKTLFLTEILSIFKKRFLIRSLQFIKKLNENIFRITVLFF